MAPSDKKTLLSRVVNKKDVLLPRVVEKVQQAMAPSGKPALLRRAGKSILESPFSFLETIVSNSAQKQ